MISISHHETAQISSRNCIGSLTSIVPVKKSPLVPIGLVTKWYLLIIGYFSAILLILYIDVQHKLYRT